MLGADTDSLLPLIADFHFVLIFYLTLVIDGAWKLKKLHDARRVIEMVERDKLNWNLDAVHDCSAIDLKVATHYKTHYKTGRIPFFSPQQSILLHVVWYLSFLELFFALIKACLAFHTDSFL